MVGLNGWIYRAAIQLAYKEQLVAHLLTLEYYCQVSV
jgi:hypothetical protein